MNERLKKNYEFEQYVCNHFGDLYQLSNKLYYKILKWEKRGMRTTEAYEAAKKWVIDDINLDPKYPKHVEVLAKRWIHAIDVDWEAGTGTSEWLYLIETCDIIMWIRVEIDDPRGNGKIIDIEDTFIVKYPRF